MATGLIICVFNEEKYWWGFRTGRRIERVLTVEAVVITVDQVLYCLSCKGMKVN